MITFFRKLKVIYKNIMDFPDVSLNDYFRFLTGGFAQIIPDINRIQLIFEQIQNIVGDVDSIVKNNLRSSNELQEYMRSIDKRNSELVRLLTKYFELEKMKVERESVKQEENKPTEDDKRF